MTYFANGNFAGKIALNWLYLDLVWMNFSLVTQRCAHLQIKGILIEWELAGSDVTVITFILRGFSLKIICNQDMSWKIFWNPDWSWKIIPKHHWQTVPHLDFIFLEISIKILKMIAKPGFYLKNISKTSLTDSPHLNHKTYQSTLVNQPISPVKQLNLQSVR